MIAGQDRTALTTSDAPPIEAADARVINGVGPVRARGYSLGSPNNLRL